MRFFTSRSEDIESAVGIVILDEIGPHLHPRWKMRVVEQLRAAFPRVRFLATTHDPLCLRGLRNGEVVVMERDDQDRITALTELPALEGLRVDQILTSDHFGLSSAADPKLDAVAREYSILSSKRTRTPAETVRLRSLEQDLERLQVVGTTRTEQLTYQAAAAYLAAQRAEQSGRARKALPTSAVDKLAALWVGRANPA
jgi:hypothetical protein